VSDIDEAKYKDFFEKMRNFKHKQAEQKKRGFNDFNLLTTVLKSNDEVRLHSRMIAALLNPQGLHYQGALFLELFLQKFGGGFPFDAQRASVKKEKDNVDIYITDGIKHIIIENKVDAKDQPEQIKRYIQTIKEKNLEATSEDIVVVYLSKDREMPSSLSLGDYFINDKYVYDVNGHEVAIYFNMHYGSGILEWLYACKNEVHNITNLNESLEQYIHVVKKIIYQYKGKVMRLKELLENNDNYTMAREIAKNFEDSRTEMIK